MGVVWGVTASQGGEAGVSGGRGEGSNIMAPRGSVVRACRP